MSFFKKIMVLVVCLAMLPSSVGIAQDMLTVGASPVPHARLLEAVKDDLGSHGIELKIVEFTDYVKPNLALNDGELDANFFQHLPYLHSFAKDHGLDLVSAGSVHVEPLGLYSKKHSSVEEFPEGGLIAIPSDSVNGGRALLLLQSEGIIKLDPASGLEATELDVVENPKKLKFKSIESAQLPRVLQDVDGAVINGNYAIEAGLNPSRDGLIIEGADSPYANIVAVRASDRENPAIVALMKALQSDEVKEILSKEFEGAVVPAFGPGE
ncbi:MAG: MetQ/NlpA family ABC transporter substrate-binding protein [Dethiosulfovibrio sp.]|nr:MetQ/NlpA family ABC transporter substrate-binding protein [Dethiosulfovibrio sp.]